MVSQMVLDTLSEITVSEIQELDFSRLVGLVNEPNMPSGGGQTVRRVLELARPRTGRRILEVGSNTGYTSIEMASWVDSPVVGVDINPISNDFARKKAAAAGISNVTFELGDGHSLGFQDREFELVFCSNVTSFISDHRQAASEYYRVLGDRGILAAVPIYYRTAPPEDLRRRVEDAIGVPLPVTSLDYWIDVFSHPDATLIVEEPYEYVRQSSDRIERYVDEVFQQAHLDLQSEQKRAALRKRLSYFYELFDDNLSYAGYSILLFRRAHPNPEPILHQARLAFRGNA
ncbi:methyltransferase family protein [Streptomyces sp. Ag109_G2-6]|uniref:class I SAM-dependent methyltransferase n=1 Tax=Streptomyces sp. Ag109_G2-6 TaxID=2485154 RepID=UPI000F4E1899|nr:class I SAM-dependent methyltransferase [Streptomyces sp. Ag109_G2-6]RPF41106.1 methyltransferase family protein [Streptomyces sp. Ag109_G2-6]